MPFRVTCPHCRTSCSVAEQHRGVPVKCGHCGRTFRTRGDPAAPTHIIPAITGASVVRLEVGAATSPGRVRDRNEDSFLVQQLVCCNLDVWHELAVLLVADGMGGAAAGDRASGLVIRAAAASLAPLVANVLSGAKLEPTTAGDAIAAALRDANTAVWDAAQQDPSCKGMGATAVLAVIYDGQAFIGHVGDTRVYHQRGGRLTQLTRDQTLVARMVELGQLTPKQALTHRARNEVTNAVGMHSRIDSASYQARLAAGDWLILACDGLHAHLDESILQAEIATSPPSAVQLAQRLVDRADELGGSDNCTVVVVRAY